MIAIDLAAVSLFFFLSWRFVIRPGLCRSGRHQPPRGVNYDWAITFRCEWCGRFCPGRLGLRRRAA